MISRRHLLAAICLFIGIAGPTCASAATVFSIAVERNGEPVKTGSLTLVAEDVGITSYTLLLRGSDWFVETSDGTPLRGEVLAEYPDIDLAILEVRGLHGEPMTFAREMPDAERTIATTDAQGADNRGIMLSTATDESTRFQHTALYGTNAYGAPVMNNCGEVIGLSNERITGLLRRQLAEPALPLSATGMDAITDALARSGISPNVSGDACLSLEEQLEQARRDDAEVGELEALIEEIRHRNETLENAQREVEESLERQQAELERQQAELEQAHQDRDDLEELAEAARQQAEELEQERAALEEMTESIQRRSEELEQAKLEREEQLAAEQALRRQQQALALAGIGFLLFLVLVGTILLRKRKQMLESEQQKADTMAEELSAATATFPDIVLTGTDPEGQTVRTRINGNALIRSEEGQIVGRDAASSNHVIALPEISRRHLRLLIRDGRIMVIDLDTHNGTAINGETLEPHREAALDHGDELRLGSIAFHVHVLES